MQRRIAVVFCDFAVRPDQPTVTSTMRKVPLYSSTQRSRVAGVKSPVVPTGLRKESASAAGDATPAPASVAPPAARRFTWERAVTGLSLGVAIAALILASRGAPVVNGPTQEDIDKAVLTTLENETLPSPAAKAIENVRPSVVRVEGVQSGATGEADMEAGVGTGVVISDNGTILTNMHVVAGVERVKVIFFDGMEAEAQVVGVRPEQDLAILKAKAIPDDLKPATMRSTGNLAVGDLVAAVGFPFGIGPSASSGVVSGLKRDFLSPEGKRTLSNLIQFDAAANPGNSGGPLVTMDGEVVGIVTAILNPTGQRVFVGIGFAVPIESAANAAGVPPF